jgi:hypothetical protein
MESMRESWTDERLDDLNHTVGSGFDRIDTDLRGLRTESAALRAEMKAEFTAVRAEMKSEFTAVRAEMKSDSTAVRAEMKADSTALRAEMKAGFERVDDRFEALHRLLVQSVVVLLATLVGLHFV